MNDKFRMLTTARFLWVLWKSIRGQIRDDKLDPNKCYTVSIPGEELIALYRVTRGLFNCTRSYRDSLEQFGKEDE